MKILLSSLALCSAATFACAQTELNCLIDLGDHAAGVTMNQQPEFWEMRFDNDEAVKFIAIPTAGNRALHLVSADFDTDASAAAMLTVAPEGQVFLSVHGFFPSPDGKTYTGFCKAKDG